MHPRHHHSYKRNIGHSSHSIDISRQPLAIPWQPFDISQCSKPRLTSPAISKMLQNCVGVNRGVWGGRLRGVYTISVGSGSMRWSWVVFWSFFLHLPFILVYQWWDPWHFFGVAGCPKSFKNQNVRVLQSFCHILEPWTTFWSWDLGFWKMAVALEHPVAHIWVQSRSLFDIIAVPGRLMLPHWHCDQFMSLLGSISDRLEGQSPKFWGHATHRQTTGWWWSGTASCEPISIWPTGSPPPSFWQTSKHWHWSGDLGYLSSPPAVYL